MSGPSWMWLTLGVMEGMILAGIVLFLFAH